MSSRGDKMIFFSIVIPTYNNAAYLSEALQSIKNQSFQDWEAIVVIDGSPDDSYGIAQSYASDDSRFLIINKTTNEGTHLARKSGVAACSGAYSLFLDADDTLTPDALEKLHYIAQSTDADIIHFGMNLSTLNMPESAAKGMLTQCNAPLSALTKSEEILDSSFTSYVQDWRILQRLYKTTLLKQAFTRMANQRMGRGQDSYEWLVIASLADYEAIHNDVVLYNYNLGRGITNFASQSLKQFVKLASDYQTIIDCSEDYANSFDRSFSLQQYILGLKNKLFESLFGDWLVRVPENIKIEAAASVSPIIGYAETSTEIFRLVRDKAYDNYVNNIPFNTDESFLKWFDFAEVNWISNHSWSQALNFRRNEAERDIMNWHNKSEDNKLRVLRNNQSIRIFVSTHKKAAYFDSNILQPVQVGTAATKPFPFVFHDNEGDNISRKNPLYCELTAQYWAWKNVDADYYGFCHYRRYFNFSDTDYTENSYGEIMDDYIDADAVSKYGLDDRTMEHAICGYDVITTRYGNLEKIIDKHGSPKAVWEAAPKLIDEDLHRMYDILCTRHPDYRQDAIAFLKGNRSCFCNMFIMKKDIFFDYCEWLFPLLEEFERCTDMSHYSKEALRTPGHLSERLLNIYLMHHKRIGTDWKTKELQCVHFTNPEPEESLEPLTVNVPQSSIVPVVFAADDNYVPQLTTTIYSAMKNANPNRFYDVVVLQRNITGDKQERLKTFFSQRFTNMKLRFINVDRKVAGVKLTTNNAHISVETYYRFLIQQVLPFYDKVLYLDSDIIINGDIAELFDTDLSDNLLAAVHDIDFLGNLNVKHGKRMGYAKTVLGMKDPYAYFQAGVLVLNTKAMREHYTIEQWLEYASNSEYIYNDQDVLNVHCEGKVTFLDWDWNVMHDCGGRVANVFSYAPNDDYDAYMDSRNHPKIIHYAGYEKPWVNPDCDFASIYWRYARETPFYERLMKKVIQAYAPEAPTQSVSRPHERAIGESSKIRSIMDPLLPLGSRRREALKTVGRIVRGRH